MAAFASLRGWFGRRDAGATVTKGSAVPSYGMIPPLGSVSSAAGLQVSQATAMTVSAVYAAVTIRSRDVARCPPSLYSLKDDGTRVAVSKHPLTKIFRRPNVAQTWFEFVLQMQAAYLLRGNAYAAIIRDARGNPVQLIPINPDAVMVLEAGDGSIFYNVNRIGLWQMAMLRDFPVAVPAEDIFHLRGLTFNALVAVSTIGLGRDAIGLAMGLEQQGSRWVGSGAKPSGILTSTTKLSDEAAKRLKQSWQDFVSGIQNVGTTAVLEAGVDWKQLQLTGVDLQFLEQRRFSVEDVSRFFNMPPRKLGVSDTTRGSTIIQEEQAYVNNTVAPDLDLWEQRLAWTFDLDADDIFVDMDEAALLRADIMTRYNAHRTGILTGIITPNEARRAEGLPPMEGGDKLLVPANTAALGSDMTGSAPDAAGRPNGGTLPDPAVPTSGDQPGADPVDTAPSS